MINKDTDFVMGYAFIKINMWIELEIIWVLLFCWNVSKSYEPTISQLSFKGWK